MSKQPTLTLKDPSRLRPPPRDFECGESIEEGDVGSVSFYTTLPNPNPQRLVFSCRGRSMGVLVGDETAVNDADLETANEAVDPNFFDAGYGLAGRTGFQIWAGSRLLVECLTWPILISTDDDDDRLVHWQRLIAEGDHVLELGAGIGVVGTSLAAAGAQVLLTDLPTLIDNATHPNLCRNENDKDDDFGSHGASSSSSSDDGGCPSWLQSSNAVPIGKGWAGTAALDWTRPLQEQLSAEQRESIDMVVASDCVWLVTMLEALLDTVASILEASSARSPTLLMSFQRRDAADGSESALFTTVDRVIEAVQSRGWNVDCLAWRPVTVGEDEDKEVYVFEISKGTKKT